MLHLHNLIGVVPLPFHFMFPFTGLVMALDPHWKQVSMADALGPSAARRLRILGALALAVSRLGCLHVDHASMACLVWILGVSASGILVAMTLAHAPRLLRPLGYPVKALQR